MWEHKEIVEIVMFPEGRRSREVFPSEVGFFKTEWIIFLYNFCTHFFRAYPINFGCVGIDSIFSVIDSIVIQDSRSSPSNDELKDIITLTSFGST